MNYDVLSYIFIAFTGILLIAFIIRFGRSDLPTDDKK